MSAQIKLMKKMLCKKLITELNSILTLLKIVKMAVYGTINTIKTALQILQASAVEDISSAIIGINNNIDNMVPNIDDSVIREILNIIQNCPFLCKDLNFKNPVTLLKTIENETKSLASDLINDLTSGLQTFSAAKLIDALIKKYGPKGFALDTKIPKVIEIIDCVEALCDEDIYSRIQQLCQYLNDLHILADGNLDKVGLYDDAGLDGTRRSLVDEALDSLIGVGHDIDVYWDKGIKYAKSLTLKSPNTCPSSSVLICP
jgi:hypothetical protein